MDKNDLLKMLDLSGKDAAPQVDDGLSVMPTQAISSEPGSPTALVLDEWALRKGEELLAASQRLQALTLDGHAVADFLASAFEPAPELQASCIDPRRREFLNQLLETPDYQALHQSTMLHEAASEIAATAFAEQFHSMKKEDAKDRDSDREMDTLRAVGKALARAEEEVTELTEATAALGLGPGCAGSNDAQAIAELFKRVRSNPALRRICTLAGRYRRVAQSRQRQKAIHGVDDMVGVTLDGDIGRLLPHELAKLAIPEFELDTLRRVVERQAMCRLFQTTEPVAKGPVIVVVDESGSMGGDKIHTAKALALALAWVARHQRRWIALIAYSGESGERLLALPPCRWDEAALMDWLCAFIGHGSTLDMPIREMPDYYRKLGAPRGKTDLIFISDALLRLPEDLAQHFLAWKQEVQARLISLVIGSSAGDLARISDETFEVSSLEVSETGVERVLSI